MCSTFRALAWVQVFRTDKCRRLRASCSCAADQLPQSARHAPIPPAHRALRILILILRRLDETAGEFVLAARLRVARVASIIVIVFGHRLADMAATAEEVVRLTRHFVVQSEEVAQLGEMRLSAIAWASTSDGKS